MAIEKTIMVTGGAGFLGSHLCDRLIESGNEVICVDNFFTGSKRNIEHLLGHPRFELMRHDVTFPLYVEVDEIYIGINKLGVHYVIPCQAKSLGDNFGLVQVYQDICLCNYQYPDAICRPMAIQFTGTDSLAILEVTVEEKNDLFELVVVDEKHYELVPKNKLNSKDLDIYKKALS